MRVQECDKKPDIASICNSINEVKCDFLSFNTLIHTAGVGASAIIYIYIYIYILTKMNPFVLFHSAGVLFTVSRDKLSELAGPARCSLLQHELL